MWGGVKWEEVQGSEGSLFCFYAALFSSNYIKALEDRRHCSNPTQVLSVT